MRVVLAAALTLGFACGGSDVPSTSVFVVIGADVEVLANATTLRISSFPADGPPEEIAYPLGADGVSLPVTQPLAPVGGDASRRFRVQADLLRADGSVVATQRVEGAFEESRRRFVRVRFDAACEASECGAEARCVAGACRPVCVLPADRESSPTPAAACGAARKTLSVRSTANVVLSNFALLVRIEGDDDLSSLAEEDGRDIGFVDASGSVLEHEIERFDRASGLLVAWVRLPELPALGVATIELVFGGGVMPENPRRLWSAYEAVWHFSGTSGPLQETAERESSPELVDVERGVAGVAGFAFGFDGRARVEAADTGFDDAFDFNEDEDFTFAVWARYEPIAGEDLYQGLLQKHDGSLAGGWLSGFPSSDRIDACLRSFDTFACASTPTGFSEPDRWYHV
ncbi:MAG: DUF2341 domain-containing protein, partial [Myxococcota bacterium]